jgi:hypothetical protein
MLSKVIYYLSTDWQKVTINTFLSQPKLIITLLLNKITMNLQNEIDKTELKPHFLFTEIYSFIRLKEDRYNTLDKLGQAYN